MKFPLQIVYNWYKQVIAHPRYRWWVILGTVAYLVSPVDIASDFLPFIGQLDDVAIVTLMVTELSSVAKEFAKNKSNAKVNQAVANNQDVVEVKAVTV